MYVAATSEILIFTVLLGFFLVNPEVEANPLRKLFRESNIPIKIRYLWTKEKSILFLQLTYVQLFNDDI
jgi:hypothetical protein